jgi:hypothetical protein
MEGAEVFEENCEVDEESDQTAPLLIYSQAELNQRQSKLPSSEPEW